ncbi:MAG TPA: hypothetical protein VEC36_02225 [Patescibacteria group bacterium]|nr:hypothetical protein [Patescibacteria group bacterium]
MSFKTANQAVIQKRSKESLFITHDVAKRPERRKKDSTLHYVSL